MIVPSERKGVERVEKAEIFKSIMTFNLPFRALDCWLCDEVKGLKEEM